MNAEGVDSTTWMTQFGGRLNQLRSRPATETALDSVEYLMEALGPQLHDSACQLAEVSRQRLEQAGV